MEIKYRIKFLNLAESIGDHRKHVILTLNHFSGSTPLNKHIFHKGDDFFQSQVQF